MAMAQPWFEVYPDKGGQWRWRLVAANGKTVSDSGEGYANESNAFRAARRNAKLSVVAGFRKNVW